MCWFVTVARVGCRLALQLHIQHYEDAAVFVALDQHLTEKKSLRW